MKKQNKVKKIFYPFITFFLPFIALASERFKDTISIIKTASNWIFTFAIIIIIIMVIVGSVAYFRAGQDKEKSRKAKRIVIYSLIGAAIIILAWFLVYLRCSSYIPFMPEEGWCW